MVRAWAESLADIVGLKPKSPASRGKPAPRLPTRALAAPVRPDTFESRLQTLIDGAATSTTPLLGGSLELVGLDDVRSALGATWDMVRDRVRRVAETELQAQLGPNDFYRIHNSSTYLICFVDQGEPAVRRKVTLISQRIRDVLLREFPFIRNRIRPEHAIASLGAETLAKDGGTLVDRLFAHMQTIKREADRAVLDAVPRLIERSRILFWPSWGTSRNVVAFNRCALDRRMPTPVLDSSTRAGAYGAGLANLDFLVLSRAAKTLHELKQMGRVAPLLIPVQFQTLSDPNGLLTYIKLIEAIHEGYRHLIALQIVDIHGSVKAQAVMDVVQQLSQSVKWLSLTFDLSDPRILECAQAPVWALATDLGGQRSTDSALYPKLRRFQAAASQAQLNTFAHGVNSIGLALAGIKAGITYLDGSAIHPAADDPRAIGPLKPMLSAISSSRVVNHWRA